MGNKVPNWFKAEKMLERIEAADNYDFIVVTLTDDIDVVKAALKAYAKAGEARYVRGLKNNGE